MLTYANNHFTQMRINKEKDIVEKVIDIMIHEYHRNIGIDIIAHRLGLSPNYLSSLFKQHTGKRFTEALTELRMKKAKEFLVSGNEKHYGYSQVLLDLLVLHIFVQYLRKSMKLLQRNIV